MNQLLEYITPSRNLNESSVILGLNFDDFLGLGILLITLKTLLKPEFLSGPILIFTVCVGVLLIPIRIKYRRKIIRDYFKNLYFQSFTRVNFRK